MSKLRRKKCLSFQKNCAQYQGYCEAFHWSGCPLSLELHDSAEYQARLKKLCTKYKRNLKKPSGSYGKYTLERFKMYFESWSATYTWKIYLTVTKEFFREGALWHQSIVSSGAVRWTRFECIQQATTDRNAIHWRPLLKHEQGWSFGSVAQTTRFGCQLWVWEVTK